MYCLGTDASSSIWFYTQDQGWLWSNSELYPYIYRSSDGHWLWYSVGSDNPRWFYDFTTASWVSIP